MLASARTNLKKLTKNTLGKIDFFKHEMFSVYPYMFDPDQLGFLAQSAIEHAGLGGTFVEVGCAKGATTAFINRALAVQDIRPRYTVLDTFEGFVQEHADFEISVRGKPSSIKKSFSVNSPNWVRQSLALAGIDHVDCVAGDAAIFDYRTLGPIAWCLLDVDLYLPIRDALPKIYEQLAPGGIIIVDDCQPDDRWDGALQAYAEFVDGNGLPNDIRYRKLGIVQKAVPAE